jgi:hypothetical protein
MAKLGIDGQWYLVIKIDDTENFITAQDLVNLEIKEKTGLILPEILLVFKTRNEDILSTFNEGSKIQITLGLNKDENFTSEFISLSLNSEPLGNNYHKIVCTGLLNTLSLLDTKIYISDKKNAVEEALNQLNNIFNNIDTNIFKSDDKGQNWIQYYGLSNRQFISNLFLHSWLENSWLSLGISMDNTFVLRDILKKIKETPKYDWKFTKNERDPKDIYYSNGAIKDSKSGFFNSIAGYDKVQLINNFEEGNIRKIENTSDSILALTDTLMRNKEVEKRVSEFVLNTNNLHDKYYDSALKNMSNLTLFSTVNLEIVFENFYKPVRILDLVMINEPSINNNINNRSTSGLYFITEVIRIIRNNSFGTKVILSREAFNDLKGNLK